MSADTVPLPTAVGPASTVRRRLPWRPGQVWPARSTARSAVEALDERGDLVGPETPHAPRLGDPDLLHDLPGADLAHSGQRLEQGGDLDLADHLVGLPLLDDVAERALRVLQPVLHFGACTAGGRSLLQGGGPLLGGQGRQCHLGHLSRWKTSWVGGRSCRSDGTAGPEAPPPQATNLPTPQALRQCRGDESGQIAPL